jgi:cytochrome P450
MKLVSLLLTTTMALPQFSYAQAGRPSEAEMAAMRQQQSQPMVPQILSVDTKRLYLNDSANSSRAMRLSLTSKRQQLSKSHKKLGDVRDRAFSDMDKDYALLNPETGMTFWEEFQALKNGDLDVVTSKYPDQKTKLKLGNLLKPDLINLLHFMTWMRANGLVTFKSLMANDADGILELGKLKIDNAPYEVDGPTYVITKFKDVEKALDNNTLFSVRNYHKRMKDSVGDFMLGNDDTAINKEHDWLRTLIDVKEMESRLRPLVRSIFEQEMKNLELVKMNPYTKQLEGNIELINHIARRVPAILTIRYFGFEGISPEKIMEWSRATQDDFFHNVTGDDWKAQAAVKAGQEMQSQLVKLVDNKFKNIAKLSQTPKEQQTILDRMVMSIGDINDSSLNEDALISMIKGKVYILKSDTEDISKLDKATIISRIKSRVRTNLIGTLVGGLETTQAAISQVLNLILGDKNLTKQAQAMSLNAKNGRQQQQQFNNLVWEVLRFHPVNPVVFRYIEKDTELSGVKMKAKSHIIIATQAAMFDPDAFPNPESIDVNRFANPHKDKYFHLGYGKHRCLGDYVSMIQVPEIISGILALPNVRKMPGAYGELDFNHMATRALIGADKFDQSFPERMILEYDSTDARPLALKKVEIQDHSVSFEAYLKDYDRNHFRGCLSGWNIVKDANGNLVYSMDGKIENSNYPLEQRYKSNVSDFAGNENMLDVVMDTKEGKWEQRKVLFDSIIRASQGYATNLREGNNDLLYCRMPMKFHVCFESESEKIENVFDKKRDKAEGDNRLHALAKKKYGDKQYEIRNQTEKGNARLTQAHKTIFNKCATFADLTDTEKAFYENRYFGKPINQSELGDAQATRPASFDASYSHEDYFSAQQRYYYRGSFANPLGWFKMNNQQLDFYVRLNFTFRTCIGDNIKATKGKISRCENYGKCVNGVYDKTAFKFEGALSPAERRAYNEIVIVDKAQYCEKVD